MSQLGPAFLHRPLPALSALDVDRFWRWFLEGLSIVAPRAVKEFGWRPMIRLQHQDSESASPVIERSLLGSQRLAPNAYDGSKDLPRAIELSSSAIFETSVNLPAAAKSNLAEAVGHRLEARSPLPIDLIRHAIGPVAEHPNGRIEAPVAIARRSILDEILNATGGDRIHSIGAVPDASGRFKFVFFKRRVNIKRRQVLLAMIALAGAIMIFLAGLSTQLERRIQEQEVYQEALLTALRSEKIQASFLGDAPPNLASGVSGAKIAGILKRVERELPETLWIERMEVSKEAAIISGFAPIDAVWPTGSAPAFAPSDRAGVQGFSLSLAVGAQ